MLHAHGHGDRHGAVRDNGRYERHALLAESVCWSDKATAAGML